MPKENILVIRPLTPRHHDYARIHGYRSCRVGELAGIARAKAFNRMAKRKLPHSGIAAKLVPF